MQVKIQAAQGVPLARIADDLGIDRKKARKLRNADAEPTVAVRRRAQTGYWRAREHRHQHADDVYDRPDRGRLAEGQRPLRRLREDRLRDPLGVHRNGKAQRQIGETHDHAGGQISTNAS